MWNILDLNETKNKMEIKEAYMTKLQKINPEDDEEGFKKLRAAYEEALKFADFDEISEGEDTTPIGIWINNIKELYNRFSLRIDEDAWREILEADVCFSIDSRAEVSDKLLKFLMDYSYIPKKIWILFDEYFSWTNKREELIESFPEDFIEFVMDKVNPNYSDSLEYDLFEEIDDSKDYDSWMYLFLKIRLELNDGNIEEAEKHFDEIDKLYIKHPTLNMLYLRYYLIVEENEKAREIGEDLLKRYPDEYFSIYAMAVVEWNFENYELAKGYYKNVLEIKPNDYNSKSGLADCYLETENFEEAERIFRELLDINRNNNYVRDRLFIIVNKHIEELEKECESNANDKEIKFTLGWYYFKNYRYDDVVNLCGKFEPDKEDENRYFDLISRAYIAKDKFNLALEYINKWEENLKADGDAAEDGELELLYYEKARTLSNLCEYEQALVYYDKALEIHNDDTFALNGKASVLNKLKKYEDSLNVIEAGLELDSSNVLLHINKSEALFELQSYIEARDECNITIDIYPYYKDPYLIKMKIYAIYDMFDEILEITEELERLEISDFDTDIYKIKAFTNKERYEEAQDLAISLLKSNNKNKCADIYKVYYELAGIQSDKGLYEKALGYINKAIKNSSYEELCFGLRAGIYRRLRKYDLAIEDYDTIINSKTKPDWYLILKKAETYEEMRKLDEALECYMEVLKLDPENRTVNNSIGQIYETLNDFDKALEYYSKQIEIEKSSYYYISRGLLYARNNEFEKAKTDYECAIDLEPENPYPYNNLGYLYELMKEFEKAIHYYNKAIEVDTNKGNMMFYKNIIACYTKVDKNELAIEYYDKAIEDFKDVDELYYKKAKLLKNMKLYKDAIKTYLEGIQIYKQYKETKINILEDFYDEISDVYKLMEEYDTAIEWSKKALEINPSSKYGYENMGRIYDNLEDYETAIKYYKLQVNVDKEKGINYLLVAETYEQLGKKEEAKINYEIALEKFLKVKDKIAYEYTNIGSCYNGLENTSKALEYLEKALNSKLCDNCFHKECFDAFYALGEVYEREKEYEISLKYYKKALEAGSISKSTKEAIERIENLLKVDEKSTIEAKEKNENLSK